MGKFILPFIETNRGWFEIEADTLEEAQAIADSDELVTYEPFYKDGVTDWDEVYEQLEEVEV